MRIELRTETTEKLLVISDDDFDEPGYVQIEFDGEYVEIAIKDLMPAIIAFDAKESRSKEDSN